MPNPAIASINFPTYIKRTLITKNRRLQQFFTLFNLLSHAHALFFALLFICICGDFFNTCHIVL
jgi:hypothetical protein